LGPSGAGKTTLLKLILGLIKPWNGSIIFEKNFNNSFNKKFPTISYSPQVESVEWDFPITVMELVAMGIWDNSGFFPWINNKTKDEIQVILGELEIGEYHNRQIRELSGGEQKRVFLARALINHPDILILDEPTSGLDPISRENIVQKLIQLNNNGITIIITTHDIDGVAKKIPWVICLNREIISQGNPNTILSENIIHKTYGLKND
jgi:ABC-type Mn2+/Zn2+ transport system ATPase subunit